MPPDKAAAISYLKFPFYLKKDRLEAVDAWISNGLRGSVIYSSSGTGKTEIAFECARKAAARAAIAAIAAITTTEKKEHVSSLSYSSFNILYLVPRIVLINQNYEKLVIVNLNFNFYIYLLVTFP